MTSIQGYVRRHRGVRRRLPVLSVAIGMAIGFAAGTIVEIFLLGGGWQTTFKDGVYPASFILTMSGVTLGGILLVMAERDEDWRRSWLATAVFVASTILAALLFWGAV